jgi:N-acetylneuraminic acid mutarotase
VLVAAGRVVVDPTAPELLAVVNSAERYDPATGRWTTTGSLTNARVSHTATLLPTGQVLVVGGCCDRSGQPFTSAELYDPVAGRWTPTGSLAHGRALHTATLLFTGQVLVAGGSDAFESAELYGPATGRWTATGSLAHGRAFHTATLLPTGRVLVAGGDVSGIAELYDPGMGTWTVTGSLATNRTRHTATLLPTGRVLIVGGYGRSLVGTAELYDSGTGEWTPAGQLTNPRTQHTATLLPTGQVLVAGGCTDLSCGNQLSNTSLASGELYDPVHGVWAPGGGLTQSRGLHTATLLPDGRILAVGGCCNDVNPWNILASAELLPPGLTRFAATGPLGTYRDSHTATLLPSGQVLVAGGNQVGPIDAVESYDPSSARWSPTGQLVVARQQHTATLLSAGQVLVTGGTGIGNGPSLGSTELYDPATAAWTLAGALNVARTAHTATLLPSGQVLVVGGGVTAEDVTGTISAELSDATGTRWTLTGPLHHPRLSHTATLLTSGRVLVVGGQDRSASASAELYDPETGQWTVTGSLPTRASHTATLLPSGLVLVAGGDDLTTSVASSMLYDPATGQWTNTGALATPRSLHAATLLPSGQVLVTGGQNATEDVQSAELYDPATGRWTDAGAPGTALLFHTATLLQTGHVLIAGGVRLTSDPTRAELFDPGLGFDDAWRPSVTAVSPVAVGAAVGLVGSFFQGLSEASGGNGSQGSASNYPLVQLRRLDNEQTRFLSIDPIAGWSDESFTSGPLVDFPPGPALLTVVTNGIPSLAQPVVVTSATLACPPPGCDHARANLRLGPVRVAPPRIRLGQSVEVAATLRAGIAPVFDLIVRVYDGHPERGGQVLHAERIPYLPAHGRTELGATVTPEACGNERLVVVAGPGTPIEDRRASAPFAVECRGRGRR